MSNQPTNQLSHYQQFVELLKDYRPNQQALAVLKETSIVLLVAPTSSGRNTLIDHLCADYDYHYLLSDTTRQPRINDGVREVSGQRYWFVSEEQFLDNLKRSELIEAAIIHRQQVSGIHFDRFKEAVAQERPAVTDIDIQGYLTIKSYQPQALAIFILPPSFEEWLRRLDRRGKLATAEKRRRLSSARAELTASLKLEALHYVINDNLNHACRRIDQLVQGHVTPASADPGPRALARNLLEQLGHYLSD